MIIDNNVPPTKLRFGRYDRISIGNTAYRCLETNADGHRLRRVDGELEEAFRHEDMALLFKRGKVEIAREYFSTEAARTRLRNGPQHLSDLTPDAAAQVLWKAQYCDRFLQLQNDKSIRVNDINAIDPAIIRSGRIERHVHIPLPDAVGRGQILKYHLRDALPGEDISEIAIRLEGASGADIARLVREARSRARARKTPLGVSDLAINIPSPRPVCMRDIRRTAIHEAGHAVVADELFDVTGINPISVHLRRTFRDRDCNLGGTLMQIRADRILTTRNAFEAQICTLLGGLAAEKVVFGETTDGSGGGSHSDLAEATRIAIRMEASFGLGNGLAFLATMDLCDETLLRQNPSLEERVNEILQTQFDRAVGIIEKKAKAVSSIAAKLERYSVLNERQLKRIFQKKVD